MEHGNRARELLKGHRFPAMRKEVIGRARQHGANGELLKAIEQIPEGVYASAGEVSEYVRGKHQKAKAA